jgi:hypothetical protein
LSKIGACYCCSPLDCAFAALSLARARTSVKTMNTISSSAKLWMHGIGAAIVSAFVTALGGVIALPQFFNFTHRGMIDTGKLLVVPTVIGVCAYLKQSPLPAMTLSTTETRTTTLDVTKQ